MDVPPGGGPGEGSDGGNASDDIVFQIQEGEREQEQENPDLTRFDALTELYLEERRAAEERRATEAGVQVQQTPQDGPGSSDNPGPGPGPGPG